MNPKVKCKNCVYAHGPLELVNRYYLRIWDKSETTETKSEIYECRVRNPMQSEYSHLSGFELVKPDMWCGEFIDSLTGEDFLEMNVGRYLRGQ